MQNIYEPDNFHEKLGLTMIKWVMTSGWEDDDAISVTLLRWPRRVSRRGRPPTGRKVGRREPPQAARSGRREPRGSRRPAASADPSRPPYFTEACSV